ncbi:uncharacterized protein LOC126552686 [Aphis gossypii]|uniref:uncharacterized protein LOC126552686 n=1 Tax=Aphis gossypii TaxID=80765 RepID=UPI002158EEEF|nr:uncharacterized protein LOC126552686 [Aphis gossypii]XP_050063357.1 uncharacterized protein LOC126552686 [Aphis gossypii]XP_050063358.1 uncharacterized protein LOC126552686 [Aphis gossypii]XP_050063359.1 uncharacterized protein LOC126552686 [Aphis gossypii]
MQTGQTNETLTVVGKRCRVIGLINCILLSFELLVFVLFIIYMEIYIDDFFKPQERENPAFVYLVIVLLLIMLVCILLYSNYRLLSLNTSSNGSVIKKWLLYHKIIFCFFLLIFILDVFYNYQYPTLCSFMGIPVIILLVEIIIVHKFYKQVTSSIGENQLSSVFVTPYMTT